MTEREKERYLSFLAEKNAMIEAFFRKHMAVGDAGTALVERELVKLRNMPASELTLVFLKSYDNENSLMARSAIGRENLNQIIDSLKKKHGYGTIGSDPERVLREVRRKKAIGNNAQLRVVIDFLSDGTNGTEVERAEFNRLAARYQRM